MAKGSKGAAASRLSDMASLADVYAAAGVLADFSGLWKTAPLPGAPASSGASTAGRTYYTPILVEKPTIINYLGIRVVAGVAAALVSIALYASSLGSANTPARPSGLPLATVNGLSGATSASVIGGALSSNLILQPGLYWFATTNDTAGVTYIGVAYGTWAATNIGTTVEANAANPAFAYYSASQTQGVWQSSPTVIELSTGTALGAVPHWKIA